MGLVWFCRLATYRQVLVSKGGGLGHVGLVWCGGLARDDKLQCCYYGATYIQGLETEVLVSKDWVWATWGLSGAVGREPTRIRNWISLGVKWWRFGPRGACLVGALGWQRIGIKI